MLTELALCECMCVCDHGRGDHMLQLDRCRGRSCTDPVGRHASRMWLGKPDAPTATERREKRENVPVLEKSTRLQGPGTSVD